MTETELCNLAIARLGGNRLTDFNTDSHTEAILCRLHYAQTRDSLLRSFEWTFARKRATLSADTSDPLFRWDYAYVLPSDFLRLISIYEQDATDKLEYRWQIEGKRILTDYDSMNIVYVRKVTTVNEFDALFIEVLVLRLALKILPPICGTKSGQFYEQLWSELRTSEYHARQVCAQENNTTGRELLNNARYDS